MINLTKILNNFYILRQNVLASFSALFAFLNVKIYLIILFIINLTCWFFARYINSAIDQAQIALHYSVDFGIDLYGDIKKIYILPLLGIIIIIVNFVILSVLARFNTKDINFNSHLLFLAALISNIMLLGAIISIYIINF
ncbi:hypothetical protein DRH27_04755 [Candidatus Falkowbacteria bacterium]|nr:MAG: hypothetical protein DRH27_04755 [Candidatus Falkowbacteria bacterium]